MNLFAENATDTDVSGEDLDAGVARDESDMMAEVGNLETQAVAAENVVEGAEDLEAVGDAAEASLEDGDGMSADAVQMAEVAIESARRRMNLPEGMIQISFESAAGQSNRYNARMVMEGVVETVKKVWEKLKSWFKGMWQAVKDFFVKLFSNHDKSISNLKALRDKVATTKGKPGSEKMKKKSISTVFNINGKCTLDGAIQILKNHAGLVGGTKDLFVALSGAIDDCGAMVKGVGNEAIAFRDAKTARDEGKKISPDQFKALNAFRQKQTAVLKSLGGALAKVGTVKDVDTSVTKMKGKSKAGFTASIGPLADGETPELTVSISSKDVFHIALDRKKSKDPAEEIAALKKEDCFKLLDQALDTAKAVREYRSVQKEIDDILKNALELIDSAMKTAQSVADMGEKSSDLRVILSEVRSFTSQAGAAAQRFTTLMPAWGIRACNTAGAWVQASLAEFKEKD